MAFTLTVFLSTLSLRRATEQYQKIIKRELFLSTLSLRRATPGNCQNSFDAAIFYPRSPCGERRSGLGIQSLSLNFLSTLSLRRATLFCWIRCPPQTFSIHALLAESDCRCKRYRHHQAVFYPRSPCGERPFAEADCSNRSYVFYPRSPCGERRKAKLNGCEIMPFSIHALLAESDRVVIQVTFWTTFSIHALLAESDRRAHVAAVARCHFLSTLSLRRATRRAHVAAVARCLFYPRSPCGERHKRLCAVCCRLCGFLSTLSLRRATGACRARPQSMPRFLSTLSLRRATARGVAAGTVCRLFYPRSPCGERRRSRHPRR